MATLEPERRRAHQILNALRKTIRIRDEDFASVIVWKESKDPFRVLVVTILSQSCTDVAAIRAYRALDLQVGVTPVRLSQVKVRVIEKSIRVAGLHRQKAKALKRLAQIIAAKHSGTLKQVLAKSIEEARGLLQELPKVGPKTADVLLNVWGLPTISVDTHVYRVSKRLGLAPQRARYEDVRSSLMRLFNARDRRSVPLLFIAHGRRTCKARKPLCPICPIEGLCHYPHKTNYSNVPALGN